MKQSTLGSTTAKGKTIQRMSQRSIVLIGYRHGELGRIVRELQFVYVNEALGLDDKACVGRFYVAIGMFS